jgi:HAD superfamily phosphoserine phosphatase-like hydrolase
MELMPSATTDTATAFLDSVVRLQPTLAVFDCDGTLWSGDAGEGFFDWELKRGLVSEDIVRWARPRYADYRAGKVSEDDMCGEMVTMHRGLYETDVRRAALEYFDLNMAGNIFKEMRELVSRLRRDGCEIWVVSSTNHWVIRAAMRHFDISEDRIIAAHVAVEKGRITDRLLRVPSGDGKPKAIRAMVGKVPDIAFGNSRWDAQMLEMVRHPFAINPNPDLEQLARERNWRIYFPEGTRPDKGLSSIGEIREDRG